MMIGIWHFKGKEGSGKRKSDQPAGRDDDPVIAVFGKTAPKQQPPDCVTTTRGLNIWTIRGDQMEKLPA